MADWPTTDCTTATYFYEQVAIFDTTLCGDWAGTSWDTTGIPGQDQSCATRTGVSTCESYVQNHGSSFDEACECFSLLHIVCLGWARGVRVVWRCADVWRGHVLCRLGSEERQDLSDLIEPPSVILFPARLTPLYQYSSWSPIILQ